MMPKDNASRILRMLPHAWMEIFPTPIAMLQFGPSTQQDSPPVLHLPTPPELFHSITALEVHWALQRKRPYASPGPDGISAALYSRLIIVVHPYLLVIFNASITLPHLPSFWKHNTLVLVPKSMLYGTYLGQPTNLRPISLIQAISKRLEAIFTRKLQDWTSTHAPFHPHQ